ncbi:hypothetical protein, partial [Arenimonas sp.]|uniref:hypothetical protein n=1 Tax=Arenimonas sp. TaxID=1872635 RepID=UPI0025B9412C
MRTVKLLLLSVAIVGLSACSRGLEFDIANTDSVALVEAIRAANAAPGHSTIRLARNGFYILSSEAEAGLMLPAVRGRLTIEGNYAELRGYSPDPAAILEVQRGGQLRISNLVMAEGTNGTLRNYGQLRLADVDVVDGSVSTFPAIVLNHGELEAVGGEIAYNHLLSNRRDAGTVLNYGQARFTDTRIHGNRAIASYPTVAVSGGVLNYGMVEAEGLSFDDNEIPSDENPRMSFGGILNLGNGEVRGMAAATDV